MNPALRELPMKLLDTFAHFAASSLGILLAAAIAASAPPSATAQTVGDASKTSFVQPAREYAHQRIPANLFKYIAETESDRARRVARQMRWSGVEILYGADDPLCGALSAIVTEDYSRLALSYAPPPLGPTFRAGAFVPSCEQRHLDRELQYPGSSRAGGSCEGEPWRGIPSPEPGGKKWGWYGWERERPLRVEGGEIYAISQSGLLHDQPLQWGSICDSPVPERMTEPGDWPSHCAGLEVSSALARAGRGNNKSVYYQFLNILENRGEEYFALYYNPKYDPKTSDYVIGYLNLYMTQLEIIKTLASRPQIEETLVCEFAEGALGR